MKHFFATTSLLTTVLFLGSCASNPAFRRAVGPDDEGYTVKESDLKTVFDVSARLPKGMDPRSVDDYLIRAAGEECARLGFPYWDIGKLSPRSLRAFCLPTNRKLSLGVMIDLKAAAAAKPELRIEDILANSHSPMRPRDHVKKIAGKEVETVGEFKDQIFRLAAEQRKSVTVLVERSGIALSLEAPFSEQKDGVFTPEMLSNVREIVP